MGEPYSRTRKDTGGRLGGDLDCQCVNVGRGQVFSNCELMERCRYIFGFPNSRIL